MKSIPLLFAFLTICQFSFSQSFLEICPTDNLNGTVVDFEEFNGTFYAVGFFDQICGSSAVYITQWNGSSWDPTAIALPNSGHAITSIGSDMYISCYMNTLDSNWVYKSDGNTISTFGEGFYLTTGTNFSNLPTIYDVIEYDGAIITCGEFDRAGNDPVSGIARWNGSDWESLGMGLSGNIINAPPIMYPHQMIVHNSELYIVGNFRYAGGVEVNGVAKWDGNAWSAMGSGFNSTVYGIGVYNNEIWVGGDFTMSGAQPMDRIAKWNGTDWETPGFGFINQSPSDYTFIHSFLEADGGLYIAGGIKRILMDIGTQIDCGGIIHFSPSGINTFNGGIAGNDIEAIGKSPSNQLLIGGGVFGNGYTGILDPAVGQIELDNSKLISIVPNPASDVIEIKTDLEIINIRLLDANGALILDGVNSKTLNVSSLQSGIYFLNIETSTGIEVIKIQK